MRALKGRASGDDGAALVLVVIVLLTLVAFAAIAVDTAALVQERRTLQNGADAGALAVAKACTSPAGCGAAVATAQTYADRNADDGAAAIESVCGSAPLAVCTDPPPVPADADGYARVTTRTRTASGSGRVPYTFGRVLGLDGQSVRRWATVVWGGPASLSTLPLTISLCEWSQYTGNGTTYASPAPPYPPYPPAASEQTLYYHDTTPATSCPQGPSGADLPGGFGWLETASGCETPSSVDAWFDDSPGRPPPTSCDPPELAALRGTVVYVPVYDQTNGLNGSNGRYHVRGYAAFYLTGYSINGLFKERSLVTNTFPCGGSESCISGYFVNGQLASNGTVGGPSMGVAVVQFVQ